jgi:hypothetical protein
MRSDLPAPALEKLKRVCGLLGSEFDGERANAAAAATRILHDHKLTWAEFIENAGRPKPAPEAKPKPEGKAKPQEKSSNDEFPFYEACVYCLRHAGLLSDWETKFLNDIKYRTRLTEKQRAVAQRLAAKVKLATQSGT